MPLRLTPGRAALLAVLVAAVLAAFLFLWRKNTPPLAARLLPESDAIIYCNLSPLRAATHFNRRPVVHDPDYQRFIDATGIDVERDLNEAAFALDHLPNPAGPNGGLAFSEVFAGRFDPVRLARYLSGIAASSDTYGGRTIFSIPSQGRTVRIALLPRSMVAVSNTPTPEQIHSILDRARSASLPFNASEPTLLAGHYRDLPALSLAWGLGQIGLPFGDHGEFRILGLTLPFRLDATFVASLRWTGALRLRVEEIAPTESSAQASAAGLQALLSMGRIAENNLPAGMTDTGAQSFFNSASVTQHNDRAVLKATLPETLLRSLLESQAALAPHQ